MKLGDTDRLFVCGEVLEKIDFDSLEFPSWINDRIINSYLDPFSPESKTCPTQCMYKHSSHTLPSCGSLVHVHVDTSSGCVGR